MEWLGQVEYQKALEIQQTYVEKVQSGELDQFIIGLEHPAVVTIGHRAQKSEEVNSDCTIPVIETSRGGQATLHSPGQLVIYPIINLRKYGLNVRDYVCFLLKTTQKLLLEYDVLSQIDEEQVGIYTQFKQKVAYLGIRVDRGVSYHGLSINISNDLKMFKNIKSCGVANSQQTSLLELTGYDVPLENVFIIWEDIFKQQLKK